MNTKSLAVGQVVYMVSGGVYYRSGKVVRVAADGIDVDMRYEARLEIWKFGIDGKTCDSRSVGYVPEPFEFDGAPSTYEGIRWELCSENEARGIEPFCTQEKEARRKRFKGIY